MSLLKYFFIITVVSFFSGCGNDESDTGKQKQQDLNEIKSRTDTAQMKINYPHKNNDSLSGMYKIDSIKIDSTLKKINPLK